jgi:hypothetical protein
MSIFDYIKKKKDYNPIDTDVEPYASAPKCHRLKK